MKRGDCRINVSRSCLGLNTSHKGLSTVASVLIIMGMVIAIGVVTIIIYNIVSEEIEYSTESNISLQIQKNSVIIDENNKISLMVTREAGDAELEKIKFVLFDGENIEEIEKKATDFGEMEEMSFSFTPKLVTNAKTISIVPIIKVGDKRKYLKVANSIKVELKSGNVSVSTSETICGNAKLETGEQCDDGNLVAGDGCSVTCRTETTTSTTTSSSTSSSTTTSLCGNSVVNSGEQCDSGSSNGVACSASYGTNCTYCSSGCVNVIVQGARCGDSTCNSPTEAYASCPGDCPLCTAGQTQQCGSTDVGACAFGTQTCSAEKTWGSCIGSVTPVAESCNNIDDDCDGSTDESLTTTSGCNQVGYCSGAIKTCSAGSWGACSKVPGTEICNNIDDDCDGSVDECPSGQVCSGGNCVTSCVPATCVSLGKNCGSVSDGCGGTLSCGSPTSCQSCVNGVLVAQPIDLQPAGCTGSNYCDGNGNCRTMKWVFSHHITGYTIAGESFICKPSKVGTNGFVEGTGVPTPSASTALPVGVFGGELMNGVDYFTCSYV